MSALLFIGGLLLTILSYGVEMGQSGTFGLRTYCGIGCMVAGLVYSLIKSKG